MSKEKQNDKNEEENDSKKKTRIFSRSLTRVFFFLSGNEWMPLSICFDIRPATDLLDTVEVEIDLILYLFFIFHLINSCFDGRFFRSAPRVQFYFYTANALNERFFALPVLLTVVLTFIVMSNWERDDEYQFANLFKFESY